MGIGTSRRLLRAGSLQPDSSVGHGRGHGAWILRAGNSRVYCVAKPRQDFGQVTNAELVGTGHHGMGRLAVVPGDTGGGTISGAYLPGGIDHRGGFAVRRKTISSDFRISAVPALLHGA